MQNPLVTSSRLLAAGHYLPERRVANAEIEARLGLEPGWIARRTGIEERRYAAEGEAVSDMAVEAGRVALGRLGMPPGQLGLLILATSTPDHLLPPTAPLVAHRLGLTGAGAIDIAGACGGFLYALTFADSLTRGLGRPVMVIAANILSRRTNQADRASVSLFGDAAAAVVVGSDSGQRSMSGLPRGVLGVSLTSDGSAYAHIGITAGGSRTPISAATRPDELLMELRDGRAVFTRAVDMMARSSRAALAQAGLTLGDVDHFVPHQANQRIVDATRQRLGIDSGRTRCHSSLALHANSSAATIPLTLSLAAEAAELRAGEVVLMCAAGAGLTGGAVVYRL